MLYLKKNQKNNIGSNTSTYFIASLLLAGISFIIIGAGLHGGWAIASVVVLALGELCIAPFGFALIGRLASAKIQGIMMGYWMMLIGVGAALSNILSKNIFLLSENLLEQNNAHFLRFFFLLGICAVMIGVISFFTIYLYENKLSWKMVKDI
jgi:dipeptide/tripeptide permease